MTLTNHLLTGAVVGKFLPWPLAIPVAFASHFAVDALPHFGFKHPGYRQKHRLLVASVVGLDFILAVAVSVWLIRAGHMKEFYIGLVAYSPDTFWVYRFVVQEKFGKLEPREGNRFVQFHLKIQKYERIWGIFVEIIYGVAILALLR